MNSVTENSKKNQDQSDQNESAISEEQDLVNSEVTDEEDIEEEKEKDYKLFKWPEDDDEVLGYRVRGKKSFSKAAENLKINFKKAQKQNHLNDVSIKVSEVGTIPHGTEYDVDVIKDEEKGSAIVKIYGPNKKKKQYSIVVSKCKKSDSKNVEIVTKDIIIPLVDMFLSGKGWGSLFKSQVAQKTKD